LHTDGHPAKEENSATASRHKRTTSTIYTSPVPRRNSPFSRELGDEKYKENGKQKLRPGRRQTRATAALEDDIGEEKLEELPLQLYKDLPPRSQAPLHPPSPQGTPEGRGPADRRRKGEIAFKIA
jgi:hypothetical protein